MPSPRKKQEPGPYRLRRVALKLVREASYMVTADSIGSPAEAHRAAMAALQAAHGLDPRESLFVLHLDTKNRVMGVEQVFAGAGNTTYLTVADVFRGALVGGAQAIILAHNHPSGDPTPSPEDITITRQINQAGSMLGVELLDHIVFSDTRYVSLKERGQGF